MQTNNTPETVLVLPVFKWAEIETTPTAPHQPSFAVGDAFVLRRGAKDTRLSVAVDGCCRRVARTSVVGCVGHRVSIAGVLKLQNGSDTATSAMVLEESADSAAPQFYLSPLAPISAGQNYDVLSYTPANAAMDLEQIPCIAFAAGTHVLLDDGDQTLIETLHVGDMVMTQDNGPQPIRWIGRQTVSMDGPLAPVTLARGALSNTGELTLSRFHRVYPTPDHPLWIDEVEAAQAAPEPSRRTCDYFQILFDEHEVIFVEGLAADAVVGTTELTPANRNDLG